MLLRRLLVDTAAQKANKDMEGRNDAVIVLVSGIGKKFNKKSNEE